MKMNISTRRQTMKNQIEATSRVIELEDEIIKFIDFNSTHDRSLIAAMFVIAYLRLKLTVDELKKPRYGYKLDEDIHFLFIESKRYATDPDISHEAMLRIQFLDKLPLSFGSATADEVTVALFNVARDFFARALND